MQETEAIAHGIPVFMQNSIILQTFGVQGFHPCQAAENIQIPPYISPSKALSYIKDPPESQRRNIFAYFRGKMEINPKNVSGLIYSRCASVPILCQAIASFASCGLYLSRPKITWFTLLNSSNLPSAVWWSNRQAMEETREVCRFYFFLLTSRNSLQGHKDNALQKILT